MKRWTGPADAKAFSRSEVAHAQARPFTPVNAPPSACRSWLTPTWPLPLAHQRNGSCAYTDQGCNITDCKAPCHGYPTAGTKGETGTRTPQPRLQVLQTAEDDIVILHRWDGWVGKISLHKHGYRKLVLLASIKQCRLGKWASFHCLN